MPEYYLIRNQHKNFMDFCFNENSIVEATMLPTKMYNIDAAILFSDILIIPHCLGQKVTFKKNLGPILKQIEINHDFLKTNINFNLLNPIKNAIIQIKKITCYKRFNWILWCALDTSLLHDRRW